MIERRYAVLIASGRFEDQNLQELQCPENDVDGLNKILKSEEYGNFSNTIPLKNMPHYDVQEEIEKVIQTAGKDDLILIYYSGHGKQDRAGKLHLATFNTKVERLKSTSISINSIKELLEDSRTTKVILILDCCYSGLAGEAFTRGGVDEELQSLSSVTGTYIITASGGTQVALEKPEDGYGVFTKHAIEGITSWEAANKEGNVTMDSLYSYIHKKMSEDRVQTPMKWALNVKGELVIASKNKSKLAPESQYTTDWDSLTKALKNDDPDIRKLAVQVLRKMGIPAIKPLIQALEDDDPNIRRETAEALGFIGDLKAIAPLIQALRDDDNYVREESMEALRKIGVPAIEPLARVLKNEDPNIRRRAVIVLGNIGVPAVEHLIQALNDSDNQVRKHAAQALGETRDARAVEPLIHVLKDSDNDLLREVVSALEKIGIPAVDPLIQALKDRDGQVRKQATRVLGEIRDVKAVGPLIQVLKDNDSAVRGRAATALCKIGDVLAVEPLIQVLKDSDSDVRGKAAFALGKIGDAKAVEPLIHALKDDDSEVRKNATMALGGIGIEEIRDIMAIQILIQELAEKDSSIHGAAERVLTNIWAIEPLIQALKNNDEIIRLMVVRILGKIGASRAVEPLVQTLKNDGSADVREEAAFALGEIGHPKAVEPLVQASRKDNYEQVREAAVVAMGRILKENAYN